MSSSQELYTSLSRRPPQQPLNDKMRHGFDIDYNSEKFLNSLANTFTYISMINVKTQMGTH